MALALVSGVTRADFHVVVNASNPQLSMTEKEALALFMGRTRGFGNGDFARTFDLPRDSAARAGFYMALTGLNPAQINSYWSRLMFAGQTMPPQALADEAAMANVIRQNPNAIGYLTKEPADKSLRTVLVLKEPK